MAEANGINYWMRKQDLFKGHRTGGSYGERRRKEACNGFGINHLNAENEHVSGALTDQKPKTITKHCYGL